MKNLDLVVELISPFIDEFNWKKGEAGQFLFSGLDLATLNILMEDNLSSYCEAEWGLICMYRDFMINNESANCYGILDIRGANEYNIYVLGVVGRPSEEKYVGPLINNLKDLCWPIHNMDYKFLKYKDLYYTWFKSDSPIIDDDCRDEEALLCQEK